MKLLHSFRVAVRGLWWAGGERNVRIHLGIFLLVVLAGIYFGLAQWEWALIFLASGLVVSAEVLNTALEELADVVKESENLSFNKTMRTRDIAAGGVLVAAIAAASVGILIFGPRITLLFW